MLPHFPAICANAELCFLKKRIVTEFLGKDDCMIVQYYNIHSKVIVEPLEGGRTIDTRPIWSYICDMDPKQGTMPRILCKRSLVKSLNTRMMQWCLYWAETIGKPSEAVH